MQATEARDSEMELERRKLTRRQWRALKAALEFDREKRTPSVVMFLSDLRSQSVAPVSMLTLGKVAAVVAVAVLGYHFLVPGFTQRVGIDSPVITPPSADNRVENNGTELASLQVPDDDVAMEAVETAAPVSADDTPVLEAPQPELLAVVEEKPAVPDKVTPAELSRAAVADLLKPVKCAALKPSVDAGVVNLQGYVSRQFDLEQLQKKLLALPGAKEVNAELTRFNPSKCAVVDLLAPYWAAGQSASKVVSIETRQADNEFVEGEKLVVDIATPAYETYVNVDYFSLDGGVVHMVPSPRATDNQAPANYKATIGDLGEWIISKPFGSEMVTLLLTPEPLFDKMRDEYETGSDYLKAVETQLKRIAETSGSDKITADFVVLDTRPKSFLQKLLPDGTSR
jgi:hypothetical protein